MSPKMTLRTFRLSAHLWPLDYVGLPCNDLKPLLALCAPDNSEVQQASLARAQARAVAAELRKKAEKAES